MPRADRPYHGGGDRLRRDHGARGGRLMPDRAPATTTNLDRYGSEALPWERAHAELAKGSTGPDLTHFLGTIDPGGHPHVAGVGAAWLDGDLYFPSNLATHKARNLAANPACTIAVKV